jgi:hypothetical protein
MMENAAGSCGLSLFRNQADWPRRLLRQAVRHACGKARFESIRKESCYLGPRLVRPDDCHAGDACDVPTDML